MREELSKQGVETLQNQKCQSFTPTMFSRGSKGEILDTTLPSCGSGLQWIEEQDDIYIQFSKYISYRNVIEKKRFIDNLVNKFLTYHLWFKLIKIFPIRKINKFVKYHWQIVLVFVKQMHTQTSFLVFLIFQERKATLFFIKALKINGHSIFSTKINFIYNLQRQH